ncbi:MAG: hypothetical protein WCV55_00875 [Candidatus Paceibacterota bacterium]
MQENEKKEIETPKEGLGGIIGIAIIILVLLAGAVYFYNQRLLSIKKTQMAASATATDPFLASVLKDLNSASSTDIQGNLDSIDNALAK